MILEEKEQEKSKIYGCWILLLRLCFKFIIFTCYQTSSDCICIFLNLKPLTEQCIYLVHYFKRRFFVIGASDLCVYYRNEKFKKIVFQSNVAAASAKLALFWDWLFYGHSKKADNNNIMNIEPAILVMQHSMKPHLAITVSLLDFLVRVSV